MIEIHHTVAGDDCTIFFPERRTDLIGFEQFLAQGDKLLGLDTETSGLNIYSPSFDLRLVQFGNAREAWVLRADLFKGDIIRALMQPRHFILHNAPYDLQVLNQMLGIRIEDLGPRTFDTRILAHLLDPRMESEGGAGLALKPLTAIWVDDTIPDTAAGLYAEFRKYKHPDTGRPCTKDNGWAIIDIDNELYVRYAGLDTIIVHRLFSELAPMVKEIGLSNLSQFEHHFQILCTLMARKGLRLDMDYIRTLGESLAEEAEAMRKEAAKYGVANVNSNPQIAAALEAMGEELTETTPSGAIKVDKAILLPLSDMDAFWNRLEVREPNPLAWAVQHAKRAEKWNTAYVEAFTNLRDTENRLHPNITSLAARTARMSVSSPPLQQLPSSDWRVRRAVVADTGMVMGSADYDQIELRVLAGMADVKAMKQAIVEGKDLHGYTAELVYGPGYTKQNRKLMKGVGFGKVYGGGAVTLARQTGAPIEQVKEAIAEYDRVYPEIKRFGKGLAAKAEYGKREVVTPAGRHLPLDRDRIYSATNYMVQSTARDILAQAIVDLFDAGLGDYLLLPIHDEVLFEAPRAEAQEVADEVGKIMTGPFMGVPLTATGEITGPSWASAYGVPDDMEFHE